MSSADLLQFYKCFSNVHKPGLVKNYFIKNGTNWKIHSNLEEFSILSRNISHCGKLILNEPNAGGNSVFSEVLSFEILHRSFGAKLLKTEMQIVYFPENSKKTDYSVILEGKKIGVSVTRAFHFLDDKYFTSIEAKVLLRKKLNGIIYSTHCVSEYDLWEKQILHCFVRSEQVAQILMREYRNMRSTFKSNTIVLVTIAEDVNCIFFERSCDHNCYDMNKFGTLK